MSDQFAVPYSFRWFRGRVDMQVDSIGAVTGPAWQREWRSFALSEHYCVLNASIDLPQIESKTES